jgi:8-oxo-dGTP pyrophosphatase MutT (NUDIX family)
MSVVVPKYDKFTHRQIRRKYSVGIALCKFNEEKQRIEMVMVKKRCTYYFTLFILGSYRMGDNKRLLHLFSRMTPEEKLVVLTFNFETMWNHHWQTHNNNPKFNRKKIADFSFYTAKKNKFDKLIADDNGKRIRSLISISRNSSLIWEIPKGRKIFDHENDIECAVREFQEETGISKESYRIVPEIKPFKTTERDGDTYYISTYYVAIPVKHIKLRIDFDMLDQICEIIDIRWISSEEVDLLNSHQNKTIKHIARVANKKIKNLI